MKAKIKNTDSLGFKINGEFAEFKVMVKGSNMVVEDCYKKEKQSETTIEKVNANNGEKT